MKKQSFKKIYSVLIFILVFFVFLSLGTGNYSRLKYSDIFELIIKKSSDFNYQIPSDIWAVIKNIRIPRTAACVIIGAALSASGYSYQEVFKNELASPDILGVSSGTCVGAALGIILNFSSFKIHILSFIFGILTVLFVNLCASVLKNKGSYTLLISGILVSGFMNSLLGFLKYIADTESQLPSIIYWTMGSISSVDSDGIKLVILPVLIPCVILFLLRWRISFLSLSENEAVSMGINIKILKSAVICLATLLVSSASAAAGTISWIGLVMPQLAKTLFGRNPVYSFPLCVISGAVFLLAVDILGRVLTESELPVSILTGITGIIIFFLCIFIKKAGERHA